MALILASQSPRRRELLHQVGIDDFLILPARGEEKKDPNLSPAELVEELSRQKAAEIAETHPNDTILAADTVVAYKGQVLGKPKDKENAAEMLRLLSGNTHQVYTGVTVRQGEKICTCHEETTVFFRPLTEEEIQWYISTGEPMDKAGSYGIQGLGAKFVRRIEGDYTNVVGLPLCLVGELLNGFRQSDESAAKTN